MVEKILIGLMMTVMLLGLETALAVEVVLEPVEVRAKAGSAEDGYVVDTTKNLGPLGNRTLLDTPYTINVASEEFMENIQASSPGELFNRLPGVNINGGNSEHNHYHTVNVRGFSELGSSTQLNGVPTGVHSNIGAFLEELESVEVVSGLAGFLYGSGNVGSTINWNFKRPLYKHTNKLRVGNFGNEAYFAHADLSGPIADGKFAYRLNLLTQNGEGVVKPQNLERQLISAAFDWNVTDNLLVQALASKAQIKLDGRQGGIFIQGDVNNAYPTTQVTGAFNQPTRPLTSVPKPVANDQLFVPSDARNYIDKTDVGIGIKYKINEQLNVRAATHYNRAVTEQQSATITLSEDPDLYFFSPSASRQIFDSKGGYAYLDAVFDTGPLEHKVTIGFNGWVMDRYGTTGGNTTPANQLYQGRFSNPGLAQKFSINALDLWSTVSDDYITQKNNRYNLFIGDSIKFYEQFEVLVGINRSTIHNRGYNSSGLRTSEYKDSAFTPTLAFMYKPVSNVTTYISYAESLEPGTVVSTTDQGGWTWSNAGEALSPMKSQQYEIGVKAEIGDMLLTAALFHIDRAIQYGDYNRQTWVQNGNQRHRGLELTWRGKITENFSLMGGANFLDAEITKSGTSSHVGNWPNFVPKFAGKLYAEYAVPFLDGLTITGGVNHFGKVYTNRTNTLELPAFTTADLGLRYELEVMGLSTIYRLKVNNITDERYWYAGGSISHMHVGQPRTIAFTAELRF